MAIVIVVASHAGYGLPPGLAKWLVPLGGFFNLDCGVQIFFVLSGYLITAILLREYDAVGRIDLKAFYCRRILRIFPAFYVYWGFIVVLTAFGIVRVSPADLAFAAAHLANYGHPLLALLHRPEPVSPNYWVIGHFWTLSMEEQFYWLWPLLLVGLLRVRGYGGLVALFLLLPVERVATYALFPAVRGQIMIMLHTACDAIVAGCFLAILARRHPGRARQLCFPAWGVAAVVFYIFAIHPVLGLIMPRDFDLVAGNTLLVTAITLFIANVVLQSPGAWYHRTLETRWLVGLGRISYSVYLWQQIFFTSANMTVLAKFPLNIVASIIAGWLSYQVVEQPFVRLKDRYFSSRAATVSS